MAVIFFGLPKLLFAASGDIVITEIMYNPASSDSGSEWVEIYNSGNSDVVITEGSGNNSWRFNDGSNHTLSLIQGSLTIAPAGFAILASNSETFLAIYPEYSGTLIDTVMSLNNTEDTLSLSADKGETFFAQITYQDSWGADGDGNTLEKVNLSGTNTADNWQVSAQEGGTPGYQNNNQESDEDENQPEDNTKNESPNQSLPAPPAQLDLPATEINNVIISEVFPHPKDSEIKKEFIEIWNKEMPRVSLKNWMLTGSNKIILLDDITLTQGQRYVVYRSSSKINLNNNEDVIRLFNQNGKLVSGLSYKNAKENYSFAYDEKENKYFWSSAPTPGEQNKIILPSTPPNPKIKLSNNPISVLENVLVSAAESTDPEGDSLSFVWKIKNKNETQTYCDYCQRKQHVQISNPYFYYKFDKIGTYIVELQLSDGQNTIATSTEIHVLPWETVLSKRRQEINANANLASVQEGQKNIFISAIMPNPNGRDGNEYIEIYNPNDFEVLLDNFWLDDTENQSKPYQISNQLIVANSFVRFYKSETGLTLNNTSDEVRILNTEKEVIDSVFYEDAPEDEIYLKNDDNIWIWKESKNTQTIQNNTSETFYLPPPALNANENPVDIDLVNIRELEAGTQVRIQGTVAVEPGILGKTFFYIVNQESLAGIQVYFSKQDWPNLKIGNVIGILGEISENQGEKRVKISSKQDVINLYHGFPPEAVALPTGNINETTEGSLIKATGQLVAKQGSSWFIDDGSGEAKITFQAGANIQKPSAKTGDWINIAGLVSETKSGYRILPRFDYDISMANLDNIRPQVLGEQISATNNTKKFIIPKNNQNKKIIIYISATSLSLVIILTGLLVQMRRKTKKILKQQKNDANGADQ